MKSYYSNDLIPKSIEKSIYHREQKVLLFKKFNSLEVSLSFAHFVYDMCETMIMLMILYLYRVHSRHDMK